MKNPIVVVTIYNAAKLTPLKRKWINNWFRVQGRAIVAKGKTYPKKYRVHFDGLEQTKVS